MFMAVDGCRPGTPANRTMVVSASAVIPLLIRTLPQRRQLARTVFSLDPIEFSST